MAEVTPSTADYLAAFDRELTARGFDVNLVEELVKIACRELCAEGLTVYSAGEDPHQLPAP